MQYRTFEEKRSKNSVQSGISTSPEFYKRFPRGVIGRAQFGGRFCPRKGVAHKKGVSALSHYIQESGHIRWDARNWVLHFLHVRHWGRN